MTANLGTITRTPDPVAPLTGDIRPHVRIGVAGNAGTEFPVLGFSVHGTCSGSIGHAEIRTSRSALHTANIDLMQLSSSAPAAVIVTISIEQLQTKKLLDEVSQNINSLLHHQVSQQSKYPALFQGEFVSAEWDYDNDMVTIHCRDFGGLLVDQKRILTTTEIATINVLAPGLIASKASIPTNDSSITSLVTSIANQFGFTPLIALSTSSSSTQVLNDTSEANSIPIGGIYGETGTQTFDPIPQSMWAILTRLALDLGYVVFVMPPRISSSSASLPSNSGFLYFGVIPAIDPQSTRPFPTITLSYNKYPTIAGAIPCRKLSITHNPRRNETFRVLVLSYDAGIGKQTTGRCTAIGSNFTFGDQILSPGIWTGNNVNTIDNQLATKSQPAIPVYTFHIEGLTQAQADAKALGIATDIQKRALILKAETDGLINLHPAQALMIDGNTYQQQTTKNSLLSSVLSNQPPSQLDRTIDTQLLGKDKFHVVEYTHNFSLPQHGGMGGHGGFTTSLTCLNIAVEGTGNPTKPLQKANAKR